jgi:hypothetical protein
MLVHRVHAVKTGSACRIAAVHQVAEIRHVAAQCLNNHKGKEMDSRTYFGNLMHSETATRHSACIYADVLAAQETVRSYTWVG